MCGCGKKGHKEVVESKKDESNSNTSIDKKSCKCDKCCKEGYFCKLGFCTKLP